MKKNGKTQAGTQRWRCVSCSASTTHCRQDRTRAAEFRWFIEYATGKKSLEEVAQEHGVSARTLQRRFEPFWLIPVPHNADTDRVYDQMLLDGTYTGANCLLIAMSPDYVVNWHWCKTEKSKSYRRLLEPIQPPLVAILDGGNGAYSAIPSSWQTTRIQRCVVHALRVVRRYTTSHPRTQAGKTLYKLALRLPKITTQDEAITWITQLQEFGVLYKDYLNEKSYNPETNRREFTHARVRSGYQSLVTLQRNNWLFPYIDPPENGANTAHDQWLKTTNCLEGLNAQIKLLLRLHRGASPEHQRTIVDWWLYLHTQLPDDPEEIARQHDWGRAQLAKAQALTQQEDQTNLDGKPASYDHGIDTDYIPGLQFRKHPI